MSDHSWQAARFLGRAAVRGRLELTDTHLKFLPAGVATRVQGAPFAAQFKHIAGAGVAEHTGGLFKRRTERLCITLGDGSEQLFAVSDPAAVADAVRGRLGTR